MSLSVFYTSMVLRCLWGLYQLLLSRASRQQSLRLYWVIARWRWFTSLTQAVALLHSFHSAAASPFLCWTCCHCSLKNTCRLIWCTSRCSAYKLATVRTSLRFLLPLPANTSAAAMHLTAVACWSPTANQNARAQHHFELNCTSFLHKIFFVTYYGPILQITKSCWSALAVTAVLDYRLEKQI